MRKLQTFHHLVWYMQAFLVESRNRKATSFVSLRINWLLIVFNVCLNFLPKNLFHTSGFNFVKHRFPHKALHFKSVIEFYMRIYYIQLNQLIQLVTTIVS